ncbi:MAG: ATP-binding protein [Methanobacteriaceae archaeon]|nr:ATP-binding protein [Methanobacteriaceae archaeon]
MKVAITGGKGGTGKSTMATAISIVLTDKYKVMLVDTDVECPDDHIILPIKREKIKDITNFLPKFDRKSCIKCGECSGICKQNAIVYVKDNYPILIPPQCNGCGACLLTCPYGSIHKDTQIVGSIYHGFLDEKKVGKQIAENFILISGEIEIGCESTSLVVNATKEHALTFQDQYDHIIIDTAAGTHCNVISALMDVNCALAVTEPTPLGCHDLELILLLLEKMGIKSKIIINRSNIGDSNMVKDLSKRYGVEILAEIPYEKSILKLYSQGAPVSHSKIKEFVENWEDLK